MILLVFYHFDLCFRSGIDKIQLYDITYSNKSQRNMETFLIFYMSCFYSCGKSFLRSEKDPSDFSSPTPKNAYAQDDEGCGKAGRRGRRPLQARNRCTACHLFDRLGKTGGYRLHTYDISITPISTTLKEYLPLRNSCKKFLKAIDSGKAECYNRTGTSSEQH